MIATEATFETGTYTLKTSDGKPIRRVTFVTMRTLNGMPTSISFTETLPKQEAIKQAITLLAREGRHVVQVAKLNHICRI